MTPQEYAAAYEYKIVTREEFDTATDVPAGIADRAAEYIGNYVLYDPLDDEEGFLLVHNDPRCLARKLSERLGDVSGRPVWEDSIRPSSTKSR